MKEDCASGSQRSSTRVIAGDSPILPRSLHAGPLKAQPFGRDDSLRTVLFQETGLVLPPTPHLFA